MGALSTPDVLRTALLARSIPAENDLEPEPKPDRLAAAIFMASALITSSSFRHERESGAMELLLVTPLSAQQIIIGRLRGCWMQLLPAASVLTLSSIILNLSWTFWFRTDPLSILFFIGTGSVL